MDVVKKSARVKKIAVRVMAWALLFIAALYLLLNVVLNIHQTTGHISRILSDALHQPATIEGVNLAGGTIVIHGLTITNPPGFAGGNLLIARSITVTPAWSALLAGRKSFTAISIQGLKLSILKNSAGAWNFSGLAHLAGKKKSTSETFIKRLLLERSAVSVNGRGITDISLSINNLSTKGSTGAVILLTFDDDYGAPYQLAGNARLGIKPSLDLSLCAPSLSFKALQRFKPFLNPEKGKGKLLLRAEMHGNELKLAGNTAFERLTILLKGEERPLSGVLNFATRYDFKEDTATLEKCALKVDGLINLNARGRMERVKKERAYTAEVSYDGIEVNNLFALLPRKLRSDLSPDGTVLPGSFRIAGSGPVGVTSGQATFSLRHGRLGRGGRMLVEEVSVDAVLTRESNGWIMRGRVSQQGKTAGIPVQLLDIPVTGSFSDRMRPIKAELPFISARINGIPVKGDVTYRAFAQDPVTLRIDMPDVPLAVLTRLFPGKKMAFVTGSATASVRASGRGPGEFRGNIIARLKNIEGTYAGNKLALADLSSQAAASFSAGKMALTGSLKASGGLFEGKKLATSFAFRIANGMVALTGGDCAVDRTRINFTEINAAIPKRISSAGENKVPVSLRFTGIQCRQDDSGVDGISGRLNAFFVSGAGGRRLEGEGSFSAPRLTYRGKGVGFLAVRFVLSNGKGTIVVSGKVLEGNLTASAGVDPFTAKREATFAVNLDGIQGPAMTEVLGKAWPAQVSRGVLAASATGVYGAKNGLRCLMAISCSDLAFTAKNGRTLLTEGGLKLDGEWGDGNLLLREGKVAVGKESSVSLRGKIMRAASPEREGEFTLAIPRVSLTSLFDAFANVLPRSLQEATAAGNVIMDGKLLITGKQAKVTGEMTLDGGSLEVPSQKLSIVAINGAIPFSLDFAGRTALNLPEKLSFSRENYPRLLSVLQQPVRGEHILTIGRIRFGTTEFATTTLAIRSGNGLTEISSIESGLYQGALLGRGFFRYQGGVLYGVDILVHDISLREVCNSYSGIKGYLSGRVDGFVSLLGTEKGLPGLKGLVAFWTRSSKNEKMLVSKEFLQKLSGKKIKGIFFQEDRPFDRGEIGAYLEGGYLTFETLDISHTNFLGIRDLSVSVAPVQNKISLDHLFTTIREAAARGKAATGGAPPAEKPTGSEFKWEE
jgi:hypothetical protein